MSKAVRDLLTRMGIFEKTRRRLSHNVALQKRLSAEECSLINHQNPINMSNEHGLDERSGISTVPKANRINQPRHCLTSEPTLNKKYIHDVSFSRAATQNDPSHTKKE